MAVPFEELAGSPRLRIADGKVTAVRRFKVAWGMRVDFAVELLGGYRWIGNSFAYTPPAVMPGVPQAIVREIEIEPFPEDVSSGPPGTLREEVSSYPYAIVEATYTIPEHGNDRSRPDLPDVPQGTFLSYSSELGTEHTTVPGRTWQWQGGGDVPADQAPSILVPTEDIRLTWERVPSPPWAALRDKRGMVNSGNFLNHTEGTVLFLGARTSREFQVQGDGLWRLDFHFKVRAMPATNTSTGKFGWNFGYREDATGEKWQRIQARQGAAVHRYPYGQTDFQALFQFGS